MKLVVFVLLLALVFVSADKKQSGDVLLNQAEALLQAAKIALPYFRSTHEFPALQSEVMAISGLIDSLREAEGKAVKKLEQELNKHIRSLSMLLYRLKHLHPIPIEPPKRPPNPWTDAPDNGDNGGEYEGGVYYE